MNGQLPPDPTAEQLLKIALDELRASPKNLASYMSRRSQGLGYEQAPMESMLQGSPAINAIRQLLPENIQATRWGRSAIDALPEGTPEGIKKRLAGMSLGGFSPDEMNTLREARAVDPEMARYMSEVGVVRGPDGEDLEIGPGNYRAKAAQAAGIVASDVVSDGARNVWWFLNAPQALSYLAVQQGIHAASDRAKAEHGLGGYGKGVPLIGNRNLRMAAAVPAWLAMSMAIGNFSRDAGYKAVLPSEADPTQTTDPIGEGLSRYFLGKTGQLMAYDDFVKERPDVSKGEYDAYKAYLFSGASPIKATLDGIHGPEVTFMGKSIPLATGILPAVAAVIGARRGVARGAARLRERIDEETGMDRFTLANFRKSEYETAIENNRRADYDPSIQAIDEGEISRLYNQYRNVVDDNEGEILKSVLANGGGALTGTALAGHVLESMRRALKGKAPQPEETDDEALPSGAAAPQVAPARLKP